MKPYLALLIIFYAAQTQAAVCEKASDTLKCMRHLKLESLMQVSVDLVGRKPSSLLTTPAAVSVINQDDIRRSGARHIVDLLRLAPGVHVAGISSHSWAVGTRGFGRFYNSKLRVMVDGRSIYTPEFSGVYWSNLDIMLEDVDHIEIIRGPGATLWGSNAVNGVINIVTKSASKTRGGLLSLATGSHLEQQTGLRYGERVGDIYYRVYGKNSRYKAYESPTQADNWRLRQAGFRVENRCKRKALCWQVNGALYHTTQGEVIWENGQAVEDLYKGGHLQGEWHYNASSGSSYITRFNYESYRLFYQGFAHVYNHRLSLDWQHNFSLGKHDIVWGLNLEHQRPFVPKTEVFYYRNSPKRTQLYSAFIQDDITLDKNLHLIVGSKFEHNHHSGFEFQPSLRLSWQYDKDKVFWAGISRAVRSPTLADRDLYVQLQAPRAFNPFYPVPLQVKAEGSPEVDAEHMFSYELGWRGQWQRGVSYDITTFYHRYHKMGIAAQSVLPPTASGLTLYNQFQNAADAQAYGFETDVRWQAHKDLRLQLAYTWMKIDMDLYPGISSTYKDMNETQTPRHTLSLKAAYNINPDWDFDLWLRYKSALKGESWGQVAADLNMDAMLTWRIDKAWELSLIGRNLLDKAHAEFQPDLFNPQAAEVPRQVDLQLRYQF